MTADLPRSRPAPAGRRAARGRRGERVLLNQQRAVAVRPRPLIDFLARACELVLPRAAGVAVCLVSDEEIARLNQTYRGKAGPTDVLSFPADVGPAFRMPRSPRAPASLTIAGSEVSSGFHLGDIAISPAAARRNAHVGGRSVHDELRVLILHGVLHLAGYDHERDEGQMERYERRLRRRMGIG
jgi:probable rRNA maturation factor